jgi:hypothetical protein
MKIHPKRNRVYFTCIKFAVMVMISFGQAPSTQWQKCFGGPNYDATLSLVKIAGGGFFTVGYSSSTSGDISQNNGGFDFWAVKGSSNGTILWEISYGGTNTDYGTCVSQTLDNGYVLAGSSKSTNGDVTGNHGDEDFWVVKIDSTGIIQWQKSLGGSSWEDPISVKQTPDSGYIIGGLTASVNGDVTGHYPVFGSGLDCWVVKLNSSGNKQWAKCYGGSGGTEGIYSITPTSDGGYVFAGFTESNDYDVSGKHGQVDYWVVKLDTAGIIEWQKCLGGSNDDWASSIVQTNDDGYIVAGFSQSTDGDVTNLHGIYADYWIVRLDSSGTLLWQKTFGGSNVDKADAIQGTSDNGFIVAGRSFSNDGDVTVHNATNTTSDYWIVKLDSAGTLQWEKSLGGTGDDEAKAIEQINDSTYIVSGYSNSTDGDVTGNHGGSDIWIVQLGPVSLGEMELLNKNAFTVFPNPASNKIRIENASSTHIKEVDISDVNGKKIKSISFIEKENQIDVSDLEAGFYFLQVKTEKGIVTKKIIVQR